MRNVFFNNERKNKFNFCLTDKQVCEKPDTIQNNKLYTATNNGIVGIINTTNGIDDVTHNFMNAVLNKNIFVHHVFVFFGLILDVSNEKTKELH